MSKDNMQISIKGHVLIKDETNNKVLLDKDNAIHPQNMARMIARALSNEPNSSIYRIAFGNGGTFKDVGDNTVFNSPNDGSTSGWESRLYNETYSEIIDEEDVDIGFDPGSSGPNVVRPGGGSVSDSDPDGAGVVSAEAGLKSNIVITTFLNENEPLGQDSSIVTPSGLGDFIFDEIGLYSPGKDAAAVPSYASVNVDNKTSTSATPLSGNTAYDISVTIINDENPLGITYEATITTPSSGTGTSGALTYGDLCEGINDGTWFTENLSTIQDYIYAFITDDSNGAYSTITGEQSYGLLTFQTKESGAGVSLTLNCQQDTPTDLFNALTGNICTKCNVSSSSGADAGVANDPNTPDNERERLLTHLIFSPIPKAADVSISIQYTLTVSVSNTSDAVVNVV